MSKLKIAIQKNGRLSERSLQLLKECGIRLSNGERSLKAHSSNFPLEILFLRDDDIPQYVEQGVADIGILGENEVWEKNRNVTTLKKLGFANCRLSLAIPKDGVYNDAFYFNGKKIATSYPGILKQFLTQNNISAEIEPISGSVEIAPGIGLADAIFDIVSTGSTLQTNGLKEVEIVATSEAVLISDPELSNEKRSIVNQLLFRIEAVKNASENKYILLNAPNENLALIAQVLPGMKSPTVLPLRQPGWSSMHSVIREDDFWDNIGKLKKLGAQGILVVNVEKNDIVMIPVINYPDKCTWQMLCQRPQAEKEDLEQLVKTVFQEIENSGDDAVTKYTRLFDGVVLERIKLTENEIIEGAATIAAELKHAIRIAKQTITAFHAAQKEDIKIVETVSGVVCWRESRPIERIGIYVPGGTAPLFSTVLMLAIPAKLAGCKEIVLCSPPGKNGKIDSAILYAARIAGVSDIYCVGGIQAVAAMALGTQSIRKVDKIFGPGNQYVTAAKQMALRYGVAIDLPAGPSELLVIADNSANAGYVAADLLSQAEHGADSQVVLLTTDSKIIDDIVSAIGIQIKDLPRKHIAEKALRNSKMILLNSIEECIAFSNLYAPEHLIIAGENAKDYSNRIVNAGSVFLGNYSCESAGDYASGTNHTLPTNGFAKSYSGISLDSFVKKITFQKLTPEGLQYLGPAIQTMAKAEGLEGHSYAVTIRLNDLNNV